MLDISIGLGTGKILAVLAFDAHHHHLHARGPLSGACPLYWGLRWRIPGRAKRLPSCSGRLIAQMGRPAAYLKDGGSELHKAVALLGEQGLASPCIDDISHAVAGMLKRTYQDHPAFETFLSACGRVSGKLKHTILACLAPPNVRTKARFMNVHRLFTWADRVLKLSPRWRCQERLDLSQVAGLPGSIARLQSPHQAVSSRCLGLLECQKILKTKGLSHDTRAQCEPLIDTMPSSRFAPGVSRLS